MSDGTRSLRARGSPGRSEQMRSTPAFDASRTTPSTTGSARTTVLVTGGAGYAGSHTVLVLLQSGYDVVVVDSCVNCSAPPLGAEQSASQALPPSLARVQRLCGGKSIAFYTISLDDTCQLKKVFDHHSVDVVIHFAALKSVGESVKMPLLYYKNNLTATIALIETMQAAGVRRLVFSSSATVYGAPQYLPMDEQHPVGCGITNPYGQTKYMCEQILQDIVEADPEWRVVLLRYFNPVGAHESGDIGEDPRGIPNNLVPYIAQVAVGKRDRLNIFGGDFDTPDGTGVRDYVHVMDLAEGHVATLHLLLTPQYTGCRAFNLGTSTGVSVLQMLAAFERSCGRSLPRAVVERRPGDCATVVASCTKAEQELGWRATRTLQEMCDDTWRWQSKNPNGYEEGGSPHRL